MSKNTLLFVILLFVLVSSARAFPAPSFVVSTVPIRYFRVVTVTSANPNTLSNYQVLITLDTASLISAGKMLSNCSDIKVYDSGGNELPRWIEPNTCNTAATNIWVKVPSIPAKGQVTLYLTYGDGVPAKWRGTDVFPYFDDFSSNSLSSYTQEASGWTISNGVLVSPSTASANNFITFQGMSLSRGYALRARFYFTATSYDEGFGFIWGSAGGGESSINGYIANYYYGANSYLRKYSGGSFTNLVALPSSYPRGWATVEMIINSTKIVVVRNGTVDAVSTDTSITTLSGIGFRKYAANNQTVDWWLIRSYSYPEPSTSVSSEYSRLPVLVYTLANKYVLSLLDSSMSPQCSLALSAGKYYIYYSGYDPTTGYLKLNSSLLYSASFLNNTVLNPPQTGTSTITFSVQDYGAGYQILQVADLQGRIAGSGAIGATGQVAMNLTPYNSYMITVCKSGVCKSIGLVTISSSNIQLAVMPSLPTVSQPSLASASYDYTNKVLRINVSCTAPPCTVRIFKSVTWYNSWQMRMPVSLSAGWNLVFLKKSNTVSASGMWAYINNTDWSEIRFGDGTGLPENFLNYSIIWSNTTHAQVLVYAPQSNTYYLYWQPLEQVSYANMSNPFVQYINGKYGIYFDGVSRYVSMGSPPSLYTPVNNQWSIVAWAYPTGPQAGDIIRKDSGGGAYFVRNSNGYLQTLLHFSDGTYTLRLGGSLTVGSWNHVAMTYDGTTRYHYVGGTVAGSWYEGKALSFETVNPVTVGRASNANAEYWLGYIGEVRVYNRFLNTTEVSGLYQGTLNPTNGLVLWLVADPHYIYDVNWDGKIEWVDLSGNGNHGVLYNFPYTQGSFTNAPQRQPYSMLVITQTCNAQLCSYTVNSGDPYFTVIVNDANGKMSQANTGLSVPLWQSPLGSVVTTIGKTLNLDAWGVNINDLFIFLIGLAILYSAFTFRNWELGIIVFGVWLSIGTLLLGGSGRLIIPGLSLALFGAALSYMLKREQAP